MKRADKATGSIRVLKFGGTCLHPDTNREKAVDRIVEEVEKGLYVVAVVSAMGREGDPYATDTLKNLLPHVTPRTSRERDALLCCGEGISASLVAAELNARGTPAVSLHGSQLGLATQGEFGNSQIVSADPTTVIRYLAENYVVVAAGFHGVGEDGSLTTLGRGGSDTVAVALAAALGEEKVLFYKDVDCLYNADPRIVPDAIPLARMPYDEAAHLAFSGAKILHPQSADLARRHGISIRIKSLLGDKTGTLVTSREKIRLLDPEGDELFAVTCLEKIGQIRVRPAPGRAIPDFPSCLFQALAEAHISLDMINILDDETIFTVADHALKKASAIALKSNCSIRSRIDCAKVSLLGGGIHGVPGIMARIVSTLAGIGVPVFQSVDTYTVISVLIDGAQAVKATQALHRAFGLHRSR
jgi:aspartate kinase